MGSDDLGVGKGRLTDMFRVIPVIIPVNYNNQNEGCMESSPESIHIVWL